jgi:hypothetical protein
MIDKYPVITLCGSTRFKDEFMEAKNGSRLRATLLSA